MNRDRLESWIIVMTCGLFVLIAELFFLQQLALQGSSLYSVILILLLLYGTFRWPHPQHLLVVLAIPSVIRLLSYTLPLADLSPAFAQVIIGVPVALMAGVYVWLLKQDWPNLRPLLRQTPYYILMILIGIAIGILLYQFQRPPPPALTAPALLLFYALILLIMAFLEEWLFRGIMQTALTKLWQNGFLAGLVVACFYAAMSITQGAPSFVILMFVFSLILGRIQHTSDNLLNVFLMHGAINLTFFLGLPLLAA